MIQIIPLIAKGIDNRDVIITHVLYSSEFHKDGYTNRNGIGMAITNQIIESKIIIFKDFFIFKEIFLLTYKANNLIKRSLKLRILRYENYLILCLTELDFKNAYQFNGKFFIHSILEPSCYYLLYCYL